MENQWVASVKSTKLVKLAEILEVSTDYLLGISRSPDGRKLSPWDLGLLVKFESLNQEHREVLMAVLDTLLEVESQQSLRREPSTE
jgi:hypothetical protein